MKSDATQAIIKKVYRSLSKELHPDRFPVGTLLTDRSVRPSLSEILTYNYIQEHEERFMKVAQAYEVLKDTNIRADYDYMLSHPEEMMYNRWRYYKHTAHARVGMLPVIFVSLSVISVMQYLYWINQASQLIPNALRDKRVRKQVSIYLNLRISTMYPNSFG